MSKVAVERRKLELMRSQHPTCRIRFRLSSTLAVDATFLSDEPLTNLCEFVDHTLRPPNHQNNSHTLIHNCKTLVATTSGATPLTTGLVPSSVLNVTFTPRIIEFPHLYPEDSVGGGSKGESAVSPDETNSQGKKLLRKFFKKPSWLKL